MLRTLRQIGPLCPWVVALALSTIACSTSSPVRSIRAARYYASGTRALEHGDAQIAIADLERAVALMPDASEIHNHLGLAYWSDEREEAAVREFERAVELDCDNEAARANLERSRAERETDAGARMGSRDPGVSERSDSNGG